ncbi:MAG: chromosome segregation ATPase [Candidatus Paceibacteria bacterium]|jgi:chromosome segregation ATPase
MSTDSKSIEDIIRENTKLKEELETLSESLRSRCGDVSNLESRKTKLESELTKAKIEIGTLQKKEKNMKGKIEVFELIVKNDQCDKTVENLEKRLGKLEEEVASIKDAK